MDNFFKLIDWKNMFSSRPDKIGQEDYGEVTYIGPKVFLLTIQESNAILYPSEGRTFNSIKNVQINGSTSLFFPLKKVGVYNEQKNSGK